MPRYGWAARADRERHEDGGVLPNVVEGDVLNAVRVGVRAGLVRSDAFLEGEHQPGALGDDQRLPAEGRDRRTGSGSAS